jgi:hypothetical protein
MTKLKFYPYLNDANFEVHVLYQLVDKSAVIKQTRKFDRFANKYVDDQNLTEDDELVMQPLIQQAYNDLLSEGYSVAMPKYRL